ncbi:hypothetical protein [Rubritalea tangerina]|uniref:hypothetical protein n=1 Tax=Rubritalea tangerina TaxID=430798 RepID=UPI003619EC28
MRSGHSVQDTGASSTKSINHSEITPDTSPNITPCQLPTSPNCPAIWGTLYNVRSSYHHPTGKI